MRSAPERMLVLYYDPDCASPPAFTSTPMQEIVHPVFIPIFGHFSIQVRVDGSSTRGFE